MLTSHMLLPLLGLLTSYSAVLEAYQIPLNSPDHSPFTPDFDDLVAETLAHWHTPGISIAVVDGDKTFSKGYGIATFPDEKVTPSTLFHTASTTKSFTATAVSLLIDYSVNSSSPLTWQTPLSSLIREDFVLEDEWATSHITLEDALSHRTGMPRHDMSLRGDNATVRDVVRRLRHLPMTAEPRAKWQYCNIMFITVAHFIETYTGSWLGNILRKRIWEPLAMNSTFFSRTDAEAFTSTGKASLARGYLWLNRTQEYRSVSYLDSDILSGAGATISNVLDYTKWLRCMMTEAAPLSSAAYDTLHFPRMNYSPAPFDDMGFRGPFGYGLGWMISNYRGEVMVWHNGALEGFATMMAYIPRRQWGFTIMANTGQDGTVAHQILSYRLLDDLLGIPESERLSWGAAFQREYEKATDALRNPTRHLYPDAPPEGDAIPLTLPLNYYSGTYTHPAYLNITLIIKSDHDPTLDIDTSNLREILHIDWHYAFGPVSIDFTHVSGENFVVYIRFSDGTRYPDDYQSTCDKVSKAEFRLGQDGRVKELGLGLDEEMGDEKIWFTKVE